MSGSKTDSRKLREVISRFFSTVMVPMARMLMRYGCSAREAADVIRWSFVHSYFNTPEFWSTGKPSLIHGAIKTGIPRHHVKALRALSEPSSAIFANRQNLAYRVVEGWVNDTAFHCDGAPMALPLRYSSGPTFNKLVMTYGNGVTLWPVLYDLIDAGCIRLEGEIVILTSPTYGVHLLDEERLEVTGYMMRRFLETSEHNLYQAHREDRRLHRIWRQIYIPENKAIQLKQEIEAIAIKAGREADAWMAKHAHLRPEPNVRYVEICLLSSFYIGDPHSHSGGDFRQ